MRNVFAHKMMYTYTSHFGWNIKSEVVFFVCVNVKWAKRYVFIMLIVDSFWACAHSPARPLDIMVTVTVATDAVIIRTRSA